MQKETSYVPDVRVSLHLNQTYERVASARVIIFEQNIFSYSQSRHFAFSEVFIVLIIDFSKQYKHSQG